MWIGCGCLKGLETASADSLTSELRAMTVGGTFGRAIGKAEDDSGRDKKRPIFVCDCSSMSCCSGGADVAE